MANSVSTLLQQACEQLQNNSDSPRLDAEVLLCHCLQKDKAWLFAWPEHVPDEKQHQCFEKLLQQRLQGQPIAYLTGHREFWSLDLEINNACLIPRPETELLVETVLDKILTHNQPRILDLGSGSGAIALALAHERPDAEVLGIDANAEAVDIANRNANRLGINNARFQQSDWFENLEPVQFDVIVSNPPYVVENDPHLHQGDVRFEPVAALAAGPDGLDAIRRILQSAPSFLSPGGLLALEHGYDQRDQILELFRENDFSKLEYFDDLNGIPRVICGCKNA